MTAMLAVAAVAATPTASAYKLMASCYGEYNTGSNATNPADDHCTGVWSDAGFQCIGIYFPNSDPPLCIGVDPKVIADLKDTTTPTSSDVPMEAFGTDPLVA
ncbi:MAG: hypothetical protein ACYC2H_10935 [Thermoplasmatota archaeon]